MHEFGQFSRLDPLHLPRAPILRHNVSLCHGRATPLFSPSATPAASPVVRSRVYGILDFGNSAARMVQLNAGRVGPPKSGRKRAGEGGGKRFFNMYTPRARPPWPRRRCLFFCVFWINERIQWCNLGWVAKILSLLCLHPRHFIPISVRCSTGKYNNRPSDNVLWMTSTNP